MALQSGTVSLTYTNEDGEDTTIKAAIVGGKFTITGFVPEPELARLSITEGWSYNTSFFLENTAIGIELVKDVPEKTRITGSASNIVYENLKPGLNDFFARARQNEAAHQQSASLPDHHAMNQADSVWFAQQGQWIQSIRNTISSNPENYAALYFIQWLLFRPNNYDSIMSVFMQLGPGVRQGLAAKKFLVEFDHKYKISPGRPAPEINGKDTSGLGVFLASFKGKIILLDFWSSYCGPCRLENRWILPVYQKYHSAGFEIISFSLDNERSFWLQAIQTDGMLWPQASDLRGGASATGGIYEITELPRNVLIDRTGKIYVKDVHREALIDAIEYLLKKGN